MTNPLTLSDIFKRQCLTLYFVSATSSAMKRARCAWIGRMKLVLLTFSDVFNSDNVRARLAYLLGGAVFSDVLTLYLTYITKHARPCARTRMDFANFTSERQSNRKGGFCGA